jgi:threonine/homoserine efflux transporter RhtA
MVSLLPVTATVIGILVPKQIPARIEVVGVALVVVAVAAHRKRTHEAAQAYGALVPSRP